MPKAEEKIQEILLTIPQREYLRECHEKIRLEQVKLEGIKAGISEAVSVYISQILRDKQVPGNWAPNLELTKLVEIKR